MKPASIYKHTQYLNSYTYSHTAANSHYKTKLVSKTGLFVRMVLKKVVRNWNTVFFYSFPLPDQKQRH